MLGGGRNRASVVDCLYPVQKPRSPTTKFPGGYSPRSLRRRRIESPTTQCHVITAKITRTQCARTGITRTGLRAETRADEKVLATAGLAMHVFAIIVMYVPMGENVD